MDTDRALLLVDDDEDFVFVQKAQLEAAGYRVEVATSGAAAGKAIDESLPSLCVVDLMMERPDVGFTLCHRIKQKDQSIPVIMVTSVESEMGFAFDASTDEERSWIKADVLLRKPVRFEQLEREIKRLLQKD